LILDAPFPAIAGPAPGADPFEYVVTVLFNGACVVCEGHGTNRHSHGRLGIVGNSLVVFNLVKRINPLFHPLFKVKSMPITIPSNSCVRPNEIRLVIQSGIDARRN